MGIIGCPKVTFTHHTNNFVILRILKEAFEVEQELGMHYETLILQTMQSLAIFYNFSGKTRYALLNFDIVYLWYVADNI